MRIATSWRRSSFASLSNKGRGGSSAEMKKETYIKLAFSRFIESVHMF